MLTLPDGIGTTGPHFESPEMHWPVRDASSTNRPIEDDRLTNWQLARSVSARQSCQDDGREGKHSGLGGKWTTAMGVPTLPETISVFGSLMPAVVAFHQNGVVTLVPSCEMKG